LDICFAALFYRILASNAFFSLKKMTRYLQATPTYFLEPLKGFSFQYNLINPPMLIWMWSANRIQNKGGNISENQ